MIMTRKKVTKTKKKAAKKKVAKKTAKKVTKKTSAQKKTTKKPVTKTHKFKAGMLFEYDPAPESIKVEIKDQYQLFINGEFVAPTKKKYFATVNPANNQELSQLAEADQSDVDRAVKAARHAYENVWSKLSGMERAKYLFRIARIIQERARELAILETMDGGKPIKESRDVDIPLVAHHFFYHAGWADKWDYIMPGKKLAPLGVCGQIIPWNFPLLMAAWKIAPALAAGNCVVLKPAEQTSLTALRLAEIFQEAELPPGVVNIVTGAGATGEALVKHPDVNKIAFTGSTDIGRRIAHNLGESDKKLTLELGGKSANIIYADAAIDQAIEGVINGIYFNQGHVCCAGSRLLVQEPILDTVLKKLQKRMAQIRVGDPLDKNTDMGAINSKEQLDKIKSMVSEAKKDKVKNFYSCEANLPRKGNFFSPCYFVGLSSSHTINREEVFGPVLSILTFRTPEEAIQKANDTPYGLAAGIWSEKSSKIHWTAARLNAGVIWANTYNKFDATAPFGGYKESGFGREGGRHGMLAYMEVK
jgi:aldehyde dehydrogenase (NAD+)